MLLHDRRAVSEDGRDILDAHASREEVGGEGVPHPVGMRRTHSSFLAYDLEPAAPEVGTGVHRMMDEKLKSKRKALDW